jgi:hypothetical protein
MKNVIIVLSIVLFLFVAGICSAGDSKPVTPDDSYYTLFYDNNGKIKNAALTENGTKKNCTLVQGRENVNQEKLRTLFKEYPVVEAISVDVFKFSKHSGCIVYMGGHPVCICCP